MSLSRTRFIACLLVSAGAASTALAQAIPPASLPSTIDPGRQQLRLRPQDRRPDLSNAPLVNVPDEPHAPIGRGAVAQNSGGSFVLRDVRIQGATAIPQAELTALTRGDIGKTTDLDGLRTIADRITTYYRRQGFILSRAIVPANQSVGGGVVTIQVIEGYVDSVTFNGAEEQNQALIKSYGDKIKASRPLNNKTLERYLLLMDDITGATARGVLSPSQSHPGASQLTVTFDYKAIDGNATIDNRGSNFLGQVQYSALAGENSMLGLSERIQLRGIASGDVHELRFIEGSYLQPVGPEGTTLRVAGSYSETHPGSTLKPLDIDGDSEAFSLDARHPILRSRKQNLYATGGFRYRDSQTDILNTELYDDHVRAVYLGGAYDVLDGWQGVDRLDLEVVQGIDGLGASDENDLQSRSNAVPDFTHITGQFSRIQPLDRFYSLFGALAGQYSFDPLVTSEEFAVGGQAFGSAFDPAEITGDSGVAGRAELRYSNTAPDANIDIFQIYGFYDMGQVWNRDAVVGEETSESLSSLGFGTRFTFLESFVGSFEAAFPMTHEVEGEQNRSIGTRGFFSLSYLF